MPIQIACPSCATTYNLADTQRGKTVRCKDCGDTFQVHAPDQGRGRDETPPPMARFAPREDRSPPPPLPRRERDDYDDRPRPRDDRDDRPRPRPRASGGNGLLIGVLIGGGVLLLLLVGGVVLTLVLLTRTASNKIAQVSNPPPGFNQPDVFAPAPFGNNRPGFGGPKFGAGAMPGLPAGADWNRLRIGMTEAEVLAMFGEPAQRKDYQDIHVIHANVKPEEVMGQNGKTRPVRWLLYFKGFGQVGFMNITLVDGRVYKFYE